MAACAKSASYDITAGDQIGHGKNKLDFLLLHTVDLHRRKRKMAEKEDVGARTSAAILPSSTLVRLQTNLFLNLL